MYLLWQRQLYDIIVAIFLLNILIMNSHQKEMFDSNDIQYHSYISSNGFKNIVVLGTHG